MKTAKAEAMANERNVALAMKHTDVAAIVVRDSVNKNIKNFQTSNWNPSITALEHPSGSAMLTNDSRK